MKTNFTATVRPELPVVQRSDDWDCQVLSVGVVGVNNGTGFSQGSEVLLGGGSIVRVKRSHGSIRVDNQLGLGGSENSGQYLGRRRDSVSWAVFNLVFITRNCMTDT